MAWADGWLGVLKKKAHIGLHKGIVKHNSERPFREGGYRRRSGKKIDLGQTCRTGGASKSYSDGLTPQDKIRQLRSLNRPNSPLHAANASCFVLGDGRKGVRSEE